MHTAPEAKCARVNFGVESGSQKIVDKICKGINLDQVRAAFALARRHGLQTVAYFIMGLPEETIEDARRTVDLIFEIDPDYIVLHALVPQPGSQIYREAVPLAQFSHRTARGP